jgi:hypothetical protein
MTARHARTASSPEAVVAPNKRTHLAVGLVAAASVVAAVGLLASSSPANAAAAPIGLGTAGAYSVLGGSTVTNTGPTVLAAGLGVSPGTAITGFPPGIVSGTTHAADANAAQAQADLTTAYNDAAGRAKTADVSGDLVGQTLVAGIYKSTDTLSIGGTLTLNAQGDPSSVFIFQVASTLITATSSHVALINGAQACNVYWQVGSSATLGTTSTMVGTVMALTSVTVTTGTLVQGRALARNGAVTLDNNVFQQPGCNTTSPTTTADTSSTTQSTNATSATATTGTSTEPDTGTTAVTTTSSDGVSGLPSTGSTSTTSSSALSGATSSARNTRSTAAQSGATDSAGALLSSPTTTVAGRGLASTGTAVQRPLIVAGILLLLGACLTATALPRLNRRQH